ncbi:cytochrome c oxidase assembly protein [Ilumatobacter sp.]|uniref:cytochrome c oxidase assembly protein n=1 Tax=Ilumatobacter sp. TaxID=1967498 RepID=UPI003B52E373
MIAQVAADAAPWAFRWHPEVWALVAFLIGAYVYMVRVIGPRAVPEGTPAVTRANKIAFAAAMGMLWVASDWPMHDIGEQYLYSAHMLQHMMLSYFLPPLALLATPTWLMRVLIGEGRLRDVVGFLAKPVIAGVLFNLVVIVTHVPQIVSASVDSGPLHYTVHVAVVLLSLLMWMPVVGPLPELRIGPLGKCIYLFLQSVVPTVPAAWLTFAEGVVYKSYDIPVRVFGWSVTVDQQLAGAIMKTGGGIFLWSIVVFIFFRRFAHDYASEHDYRRSPGTSIPDAEIVGSSDAPLTTEDVEKAFASSRARTGD